MLDRAAATATTPAVPEKMNVPSQRSMLLPTANDGVERRKPGLRGGVRAVPPTSVAPAGRLPSREDWSTRAAPPCAPAPGSPAPPPPGFSRSTAAAPTGRLGAAFSCPPRPRAPSRQPSRPPPPPPPPSGRGRGGAGGCGAGRPENPCGWAMAHLSRPVIHPPTPRARGPGPPRPPLPSPDPTRRPTDRDPAGCLPQVCVPTASWTWSWRWSLEWRWRPPRGPGRGRGPSGGEARGLDPRSGRRVRARPASGSGSENLQRFSSQTIATGTNLGKTGPRAGTPPEAPLTPCIPAPLPPRRAALPLFTFRKVNHSSSDSQESRTSSRTDPHVGGPAPWTG